MYQNCCKNVVAFEHSKTTQPTSSKIANDGIYMPFKAGFERDLNVWHAGNQAASIIYSTKGCLIYSKLPFKFTMKDDSFEIESTEPIEFKKVGSSMKDAYKYLVEHYFINTHTFR